MGQLNHWMLISDDGEVKRSCKIGSLTAGRLSLYIYIWMKALEFWILLRWSVSREKIIRKNEEGNRYMDQSEI